MLMHCKAEVQTRPIYHPTCICTRDLLQVEHRLGRYVAQEKAALGSGWASPSLTSQDETSRSAVCRYTGRAPLGQYQPYKRSVLVRGFGISPLTRSRHHPERSLLPSHCSRITIYCVLLMRRVCRRTEKGSCILQL